jgi:hypothetical protein
MNSSGFAETDNGMRSHCCGGRMNKKPWSIYEIGVVLGGFVIFWPLGLLALFMKFKKGELWNGASEMQAPWTNWKGPRDAAEHFSGGWARRDWAGFQASGNQAFDEYRKTKLEELEALRRKLDDERKEFDTFLAKLRQAKDREHFERFMAERTAPKTQD